MPAILPSEYSGQYQVVLAIRPFIEMTDDQFFALCKANESVPMEKNAEGEIVIMPPVGVRSSDGNAEITMQLRLWAIHDGSGKALDSSAGFTLPNGAIRSPDASWIRRERWEALTAEEKNRFAPLCPDFVIELMSPSDNLRALKEKMVEWIANGALLGWLIDPFAQRVYVYEPGVNAPVVLENPIVVGADPVLPGFTLQLERIWNPDA